MSFRADVLGRNAVGDQAAAIIAFWPEAMASSAAKGDEGIGFDRLEFRLGRHDAEGEGIAPDAGDLGVVGCAPNRLRSALAA